MRKIIKVLIAVGLIAGLFAGCGEKNEGALSETVTTDGSTSMEKVIGYLSEAYMAENKNTTVTYNPTGSGSGIKAASDGKIDIGLSSRRLKDDEKKNLKEDVVAIDGIAVIVNPQNKTENLTVSTLAALYKGEITNWKEVGGEDAPVVLIGREAASGTRDGFESITDTEGKCLYAQELTSTGDVVQTVAANPNAIGYASLASVKESVKTLKIEGVAPSKETIQDGSYKIQRDFVLVTRKDKELGTAAKKFFDYALSEKADEFIEKAGAVPVKR